MNEVINVAEALQSELSGALREARPEIGLSEADKLAAVVVRYLQQQYGGDRLYIPKPFRSVTDGHVKEGMLAGKSVPQICSELGISRRTFYRLLSG